MANDRQKQIISIIEQKGQVQLQQLYEVFPQVSLITLRRDLIRLENEGYLVRTLGGAVSTKKSSENIGEEDAYSKRACQNIESKIIIAKKALNFVEKGSSVYFDAGSTIMCLSKALKDDTYSIITCGANTALELVKKPQISVVTLGGEVNRNTLSMSGPYAISQLDTINIDIAFMGASGFSKVSGFTVSNMYECELKKKVLSRAQKVVMLIDSSKMNKVLPFTFSNLKDIDVLISEKRLPSDIEDKLIDNGIKIV